MNDENMSKFNLSKRKLKMSGVCQQCGKLINFVFSNEEDGSWSSYAWAEEKEISYAEDLRELSGSKYTLYIQPGTPVNGLLEKIIHFGISHGPKSSFLLPEEYSEFLSSIPETYMKKTLRSCLFPESPSYLAEKLIIENIGGELFSTKDTFHKKFHKI